MKLKETVLLIGLVMALTGLIKMIYFPPVTNKAQVGQFRLWKLGDEPPYNFILKDMTSTNIWSYDKKTAEWVKRFPVPKAKE